MEKGNAGPSQSCCTAVLLASEFYASTDQGLTPRFVELLVLQATRLKSREL